MCSASLRSSRPAITVGRTQIASSAVAEAVAVEGLDAVAVGWPEVVKRAKTH